MKNMIPIAKPCLKGNEMKYVQECINTGWISSAGKFVDEFEKKFAEFCKCRYGISCCNGTVALHLALMALDIKKGDEVIVPNLTFVATANAVLYVGAKPILVDVEEDTWCINPKLIEEKITNKTKAIIPVHLYGHPCDMDPIMEIAAKHNIYVIEDCAEAHGAEYKGKDGNFRKVGSFGIINCFSFYGNKIITTGEGGMCVTNDEKLAERMNYFKNHGMKKEKRYWHEEVGYNYRLTNIQAAVGLAQLERIELFIKKRRELAKKYNELLKNVKGITLPPEKPWAKNVYWMYSVLINDDFPINRDELIERLDKAGIETRRFFYPMNEMKPYQDKDTKDKSKSEKQIYPVSKKLAEQGINLPTFVEITEEEIKTVVKAILTK